MSQFEVKIKRLEEIVQQMEKGDLPLEDSLKMFEEGVRLSKECHKNLEEAEQKVQLLLGFNAQGEAQTEDFKVQQES